MRLIRPFLLASSLGLVASCGELGPLDDQNPPIVAFAAPLQGVTVGRAVTIEVSALDDDAVAKVDIFADGVLLNTLFAGPYRAVWNVGATVPDGSQHIIKAEATDLSGNKGSAQVTVTVQSGGN
jgi:thermitase